MRLVNGNDHVVACVGLALGMRRIKTASSIFLLAVMSRVAHRRESRQPDAGIRQQRPGAPGCAPHARSAALPILAANPSRPHAEPHSAFSLRMTAIAALTCVYGATLALCRLLRRHNRSPAPRSGCILVIGTFHNPNWFHAHVR